MPGTGLQVKINPVSLRITLIRGENPEALEFRPLTVNMGLGAARRIVSKEKRGVK